MKLLIADDETLTRTGLEAAINWRELGINEVYMAEDGLDALKKAQLYQPDIILSDIRMPHLTGIEMMETVHEQNPDTVFIFMSGYSDKDYLKAAIRLQAVSYVEKPLDLTEVENTVRSAVERCSSIRRQHQADSLSDSLYASQLAFYLTMPYESVKADLGPVSRQYSSRCGNEDIYHSAQTLILQVDERIELAPDFLSALLNSLNNELRSFHIYTVGTQKKASLFVLHFFRGSDFSSHTHAFIHRQLKAALASVSNYYLAAGMEVSGLSHVYDSYSAAVIALQSSFFREPGSMITTDSLSSGAVDATIDDLGKEILKAIRSASREALLSSTSQLYGSISGNGLLLRRTIQNQYYQLLSAILEQRRQRMLPGAGLLTEGELLLDSLARCFSYQELHDLFMDSVRKYLDDIDNYVPENSSVYLIKQYIQKNYTNPQLSTKEISEYAALSASYACTVFKNETGQTLNQYLTEYRMERAKELLADPRNNISEVSTRVGYNDSNYFGKAFKKYSGYSPSEYRESRNA